MESYSGFFWCVCLVSFTQHKVLRFTHVACINSSFIFTALLYSIVWLYHNLFICNLFMNVCICFHFGAMMNKAVYEHFVSRVAVSLGWYMFNFIRKCWFSKGCCFTLLPTVYKNSICSISLQTLELSIFFCCFCHFSGYLSVVLIYIFLMTNGNGAPFHVPFAIPVSLMWND